MKILHTADWHVGKVLMGNKRDDEHARVLPDLVRIAREEAVEVVVVAGDVFDTVAPSPSAQGLVMQTLLQLAEDGRQVLVIAGNHDNRRQWHLVYRPILGAVGVHIVGIPGRGGEVELTTRSGELLRAALLPFVSQQDAIRGVEAVTSTQAENHSLYRWVYADMVRVLTAGWVAGGSVNLVVAHASLFGAGHGGGERTSQTIDDYCVGPEAFPDSCHYAALGHLHRRQQVAANVPVHYSGAPLQVDFGEVKNEPVGVIVNVEHDRPAIMKDVPVRGSRSLVTIAGTLSDLEVIAGQLDLDRESSWVKVFVKEQPRRALIDEVRELVPNAIAVHSHPDVVAEREGRKSPRRPDATPGERFSQYLEEEGRGDAADLRRLFDELLEEIHNEDSGGAFEEDGTTPAGESVIA